MAADPEEKLLPYELGKFPIVSFSVQILFCILFALFVNYDVEANGSHESNHYDPIHGGQRPLQNSIYVKYPAYSDVNVAVLLGFGFLLTFLKRYSYCGIGFTLYLSAILVQWSILCDGFFNFENGYILLSIDDFISANMSVMAGLIAWSALLGKLNPLQLLVMALVQMPFQSTLKFLIHNVYQIKINQAIDHGSSMSCHLFGSLFGLAASVVIFKKEHKKHRNEQRCDFLDIFSSIGTLILWIYWPNLNSSTLSGDDKHRAIINTYLALLSSCVTTFTLTSLIHPQSGVAIAGTCATMLGPYAALIIGTLAAIMSITAAHYLSPVLLKFRVHETRDVLSFHAIPAIFGSISASVLAAMATEYIYSFKLYAVYPAMAPEANSQRYFEIRGHLSYIKPGIGRTASQQAVYQLIAATTAVAIGLFGGCVTGFALKWPFLDPLKSKDMFNDDKYWDVAFATSHDVDESECSSYNDYVSNSRRPMESERQNEKNSSFCSIHRRE
ncbi:hypothetical protein CHUAL_008946 [Chamberlinius hualienensis]